MYTVKVWNGKDWKKIGKKEKTIELAIHHADKLVESGKEAALVADENFHTRYETPYFARYLAQGWDIETLTYSIVIAMPTLEEAMEKANLLVNGGECEAARVLDRQTRTIICYYDPCREPATGWGK